MSRPKTMKRSAGRGRSRRNVAPINILASLPESILITEVLARVASSSFTDLVNVKLSCKELHMAADDIHLYRHVSLEKFPAIPWQRSEELSSFSKRCKDNGNPEALFREGMIHYFSSMRVESGLQLLTGAAKSGHIEAIYVLGVILLSCDDSHSRMEGLKLLRTVENSKVGVNKCRKRSKTILRQLWIKNLLPQQEPICTTCMNVDGGNQFQHFNNRGWPSSRPDEDDESVCCVKEISCESCKCDFELTWFCKMLRGHELY